MILKNTSRYPEDEVRGLVEFAMWGVDTTALAVNVKNSQCAYRGRAYNGVPACSPAAACRGVERLVTIGLGRPDRFPCDNMTCRVRWLPVRPGEEYNPREARIRTRVRAGQRVRCLERAVIERHPYGGKRAPRIEMRNWREALVVVAAHEARHIWQYQHDQPRSEIDCERFAAARLEQYRRATGTFLSDDEAPRRDGPPQSR